MSVFLTRRHLFAMLPALAAAPSLTRYRQPAAAAAPALPASFPSHDPGIAREMVGASHGNVARVRELLAGRPALARASWDWGYGDWETALGAASHVGDREIAGLLIASGAHPTIFSAAMLGHLDVVKSFLTASAGVQRVRGPHGITLLAHAKAGGAAAVDVVKYLESAGGADDRYPNVPMSEAEQAAILGTYSFGTGPSDTLIVARNSRGVLTLKRDGASAQNLFHHGSRAFNPAGAEAVRIRFEPATGRATGVIVEDGEVVVSARRVDG